jgi:hypothetical protein
LICLLSGTKCQFRHAEAQKLPSNHALVGDALDLLLLHFRHEVVFAAFAPALAEMCGVVILGHQWQSRELEDREVWYVPIAEGGVTVEGVEIVGDVGALSGGASLHGHVGLMCIPLAEEKGFNFL